MKIISNYHTHTYRCGHARGHEEEYIKCAIKGGYKILGISDHVMLPGVTQPHIRGEYEELEGYFASLRALKEKYRHKIEILIGLECEYIPQFEGFYRELLDQHKVDYLIMGQHCTVKENNKMEWYYVNGPDDIGAFSRAVDDMILGMKSGLFKYVAHPDAHIRHFTKWTPEIESLFRKICEASVEFNIPLEINLCRTDEPQFNEFDMCYPNDRFWEIASEYPIGVYIGRDAHTPESLLKENQHTDIALRIAKRHNLKILN